MAFFEKIGDLAKNLGDKTNDAIETSKLNSKINAEKTAAAGELEKIGAFYYERFTVSGEAAPEVLEFCQAAKAHYDAAAEAQAEIDRIKAENEAEKAAAAVPVAAAAAPAGITCPSCGAANAPDTKFCCGCGTKLEAPAPAGAACPACGAANAPGTKFCCECGAKLEIPAPAEPEKKTCPACGTEVAPGVKFCPECGGKLE